MRRQAKRLQILSFASPSHPGWLQILKILNLKRHSFVSRLKIVIESWLCDCVPNHILLLGSVLSPHGVAHISKWLSSGISQ